MAPEDEQMIEDEIAEMEAKDIFKKVTNPQWTFPFFVVKGKGWRKHKERTAVDFRRLNPVLRVVDHPIPTSLSNPFQSYHDELRHRQGLLAELCGRSRWMLNYQGSSQWKLAF
jgi:hypothetical protein